MKYRKKPVVIDAVCFELAAASKGLFNFEYGDKCETFAIFRDDLNTLPFLLITTLEGSMRANPGDYIIRGVKGEFSPCKPDIFAASYEPA